jgi:hypothetical protein
MWKKEEAWTGGSLPQSRKVETYGASYPKRLTESDMELMGRGEQ